MKRNTNIHCNLQLFVILIGTFLISFPLIAQNRQLQNIRRVTVTGQYVLLDNGDRTDKSWTLYQEMYDSLGRLHTEVDWNYSDHNSHLYLFHTFKGKQKVKTEVLENLKVKQIRLFSYDKDSLLTQEVIKMVKPGDTSLYLILSYRYNQFRKPTLIEAKTPLSKTAYTSKYKYDLKGTEISLKVKSKNGFVPFDSVISMKCKPRYDSIGRLVEKYTTTLKVGETASVKNYIYKYDKNNNIRTIISQDERGKLISREERLFELRRNRLIEVEIFDSKNIRKKWLTKRYELYRTNDTRNREIDY